MKTRCVRLWEVDALRDGRLSTADAEAFARHRRTCAACTESLRVDDRVRALGDALPDGAVDEVSARRLRARVLSAAAAPCVSRRREVAIAIAVFGAGVLVAASGALWRVLEPRPAAPALVVARAREPLFASEVVASPDASWDRRLDGATERVRVVAGIVTLHVRAMGQGERFLVDLPDGEIEVRGTRFEVRVAGGTTASVRVTEGVVALRRVGFDEEILRAHDAWVRPGVPAGDGGLAVVSAAAPPSPPARVSVKGPSPTSTRVEAGDDYAHAVALYRAHRDDEAAPRLRRFAEAHPSLPQREDALFLEAVALSRAGHARDAAEAAASFTEQFPSSIHARDAAELAATYLARAEPKECARARALLELVKPRPDPLARAHALDPCGVE